MGEYEESYPDAYGRADTAIAESERPARTTVVHPAPRTQPRPRSLLDRVGLGGAERAATWRHVPAQQRAPAEPAGIPERVAGAQYRPSPEPGAFAAAIPADTLAIHRGRGPRGYMRSPERIREDLCDRLTENPFVDASDIEVMVTGSEVVLTGSVDSDIAFRQVQEIAGEVIGVSRVDNRLIVLGRGGTHPTARHPTPGDEVSAAAPAPSRWRLFR